MPVFHPGNKGPRERPWYARVYVDKKSHFLGYYHTRYEAKIVEDKFRQWKKEEDAVGTSSGQPA